MNKIIPKDSRYVPLTQQKWCCVPTCIQMVMLKHDIPLMPAELLGYSLGLIVPKEELKYFWNARTGKRPPAGYGTQANDKKSAPNAVFKKLGIPLKMTWSLINKFKTLDQFKKYLEDAEKNNKDILLCFDWGALVGSKFHNGHLCVFDKAFSETGELRFVDPGYEGSKWKIVKTEKMFEAMKYHGKDNGAGCWELNIKQVNI
ncbi:MAG: hypothetical protein US63_C0009G0018 [Candidatus Moranbacteria bacterium GW2011_GWC2_37_8]|nr:MAG: hypothetical protein US63_C0009G0018 [Candidatus Moranbacteria bacterium GW2011_GWC2_37_8]KKQ62270.1 MAG: hypothetical protein US82_C0016G0018 [Parcubacteria group bacterium GW2011_GWC1_38_22]KKQ79430.1 MAG: hypothetical protein UT03_C0055G0002 [Candidatus Moranbacteria bacterium GW2011_GWD2_38_7]